MRTRSHKLRTTYRPGACRLLAPIALLSASIGPANAAWTLRSTLTATTPQVSSHFGTAVAVRGDRIAAGNPDNNLLRTDQGSGRVFKPSGTSWVTDYLPTNSSGIAGAQFGFSIDLDGTTSACGSPGENSGAGAVFVCTSSTSTKLEAASSDRNAGDDFGWSVAIDGGIVVIGAPGDDEGGTDAGAMYIFRSPYTTHSKFKGSAGHKLGTAVAIRDGHILVSAPGYSLGGGGVGEGAVHVFDTVTLNPWVTLYNPGYTLDSFGSSIAVDGDTAIVGDPDAGKAFIYDLAASNPTGSRVDIAGSAADAFGAAVSVSGSRVLIGAPKRSVAGLAGIVTYAGAADSYTQSGGSWAFEQQLTGSSPLYSPRYFGAAVSLDGNRAVIGAPYYNTSLTMADCGAVFVYDR